MGVDEEQAEQRLPGDVTKWDEAGWGFILFADGRHAYVHTSQCGGRTLRQGDQVVGLIIEDERNPGKWQAKDVKRAARAQSNSSAGGRRAEGVVVDWNSKGFGFIEFASRRRAYVHMSQCNDVPLNIGQAVSAVLVQDKKNEGKWQAMQVERIMPRVERDRVEGCVIRWSDQGYGFLQLEDGRKAYVHYSECSGEHLLQGEQVTAIVKPDAKQPKKWSAHQVLRGTLGDDGVVTEWLADAGYGFIRLDDGRRAYVHRTAFGGNGDLAVGTRIRSIVVPDPKGEGRWKVSEVKAEVPAASNHQQTKVAAQEVTLAGRVATWNAAGGYGFLAMDDGRRAYVHSSSVDGAGLLKEGELITAILLPDMRSKGKWMARQVKRGRLGEDALVLEWRDESGFGFVELEDGRKAYIHRSSFGGSSELTEGQHLRVVTTKDLRNPGKLRVEKVLGM